jgi:hypothetical protein
MTIFGVSARGGQSYGATNLQIGRDQRSKRWKLRFWDLLSQEGLFAASPEKLLARIVEADPPPVGAS